MSNGCNIEGDEEGANGRVVGYGGDERGAQSTYRVPR